MKKQMSLGKRFEALKELIKDAVELEFNQVLVETYQEQLKEVEQEILDLENKRKEFRKK